MDTIENLDIKCLSINIRGLNKSIKRRSIFRWIHNQNAQFTFLQETHSTKLTVDTWSAEWGGKAFFSHGTSNSKGAMILINPKLDCKIEKCISDENGRYIILDVSVEDSRLILVNIYAPNDLNQQSNFLDPYTISCKTFLRKISLSEVTLIALCRKKTKKVETRSPRKRL